MPFAATWMDLEINVLNEISMPEKPEKDKYHMISLICRILKNDTNRLTYKTNRLTYKIETDSQTYKTKLRLQQATAGINLKLGINRYTLA